MRFHSPSSTAATSLSTLDRRWRSRANVWGDRPTIDFAFSPPWRLFEAEDLARVRQLIEAHRAQAYASERSLSLRGVEPLQAIFGDRRLARICSRIAGVGLMAHPMRYEHCHVNLQGSSARPVDDWHQDYVPFVLVVVIARSGGPPPGEPGSGRLITRHGAFDLAPGDAVLMQGSHVWHMAEPVVGGDRITAVLSLAPADLAHVDGTRIFAGRPPYDPAEPLAEQFVAYRRANLRRLARLVIACDDDDHRSWLLHRMAFEQARLDEATGAAPARGAPPWLPRRRGAPGLSMPYHTVRSRRRP